MFSFFKRFNIFEKIKLYFVKIIKRVNFLVKKFYKNSFDFFLIFLKKIFDIFSKFVLKNFQIVRKTFSNIRKIRLKIYKFFSLQKDKVKKIFFDFSSSFNKKILKKNLKNLEKVSEKILLIDFFQVQIYREKKFFSKNFSKQCDKNVEEDYLQILQEWRENYLFWRKNRKERVLCYKDKGENFLNLFDELYDFIEYLFIVIAQLIFLTIFSLSLVLCSEINDLISKITEKISLFFGDLENSISDFVAKIEEKIHNFSGFVLEGVEMMLIDKLIHKDDLIL